MAKQIHPAWGGAFILGAGGALGVGLVVLGSEPAALVSPSPWAPFAVAFGVSLVAVAVAGSIPERPSKAPLPVLVARVLRLCALPVLALWAGLVLLRITPSLTAGNPAAPLLADGLLLLALCPALIVAILQIRAGMNLYAVLQGLSYHPSQGAILAALGAIAGTILGVCLRQLNVESSLLALVGGLCSLLGGWAVVARYSAPQRLYMLLGTAALMMLVGWLIGAAWLLEGATLVLQSR